MVRTLASAINPSGVVARKLCKGNLNKKKNRVIVKKKKKSRSQGNRVQKHAIPKWQKQITLFFNISNIPHSNVSNKRAKFAVKIVDKSANLLDNVSDECDVYDNTEISFDEISTLENYYEENIANSSV